ncbi:MULTISPECIES: AAA family ATPase [unclassified Arenibacter]|uniref:AAA family ATPase n=1 Tax=unclassified Arenibacter TaxID=2615047 RepID=UPI000E356F74|nr:MULTISPECIES: AAA family ATPase [unclassified Arenibacter]MCM4162156.1 hypothetical protein [Arenibacter sp. A80]RFT57770.1 hypothetical protein D0S24_00970 [Arenibacter sp. P308M17]
MEETNHVSNEEGRIVVVKAIDLINKVKEEPEPSFLWKGIPEGSTGLITGVGKTGKTTFAENLAISLSVGKKEFFGFPMDGVPRKSLFINLEESYRVKSRRNIRQIASLTPAELDLFASNYLSTPLDFPQYLNTENDWELMRNYIIASEAEVVFIDSLGHMCIGEIEKSLIAQNFTKTFKEYLGNLNKTLIIVHHMTKGSDKPIDQDSIAGSRFIAQEFDYAYGLAHVPRATGGSYACLLYNKYIEKDDTTSYLYKMSNDGWVEYLSTENKYNLYKDSRIDGRANSTNNDLIYKYVKSKASQGSQTITSQEFMENFVSNNTMSKDTLYKKIGHQIQDGLIERKEGNEGVYKINLGTGNGERK